MIRWSWDTKRALNRRFDEPLDPEPGTGAGDDAEIDARGTYTVTITSSVAVKSLTTVSGATVAISNGDSLTWTTGEEAPNN